MPARALTGPWQSAALWIMATLATLFFLRTARALLIPIATAVLVSYALEPAVAWLERRRVPRLAGAVLVMFLTLAAVGAGGYAIRDDVARTAEAVPKAVERVREAVNVRLGSMGDATTSHRDGGIVGTSGERGGSGGAGSLVQRAAGAVFAFAGHLVVVVFLTLFLLISGHLFRDRLVEVVGADAARRRLVSGVIDDINGQIQRYLLVLLFTGAIVGGATWIVLAWIGVEHAAMWGLLAGVFNSIPYFGPVIVSGGLFAVGIAQGGGTTQAMQMAGAALVITSLEGWLLAPPLMGKAERMNALAVFLGLLLWIWLWGEWGTVLAVPMLVVMKAVADHVERLRPLGRMMAP
jgi:predicted PurR-regulated permease PerM